MTIRKMRIEGSHSILVSKVRKLLKNFDVDVGVFLGTPVVTIYTNNESDLTKMIDILHKNNIGTSTVEATEYGYNVDIKDKL